MAMNYTTLIAAKTTAGSLKSWVNYAKLDVETIVDEAQSLLYSLLRVREMIADFQFSAPVGTGFIALPARFLDPMGKIHLTSLNTKVMHKDGEGVETTRTYTESSGTLGTDPFTTVSGSDTVTVALTAHGFAQDSVFSVTGATALNGATIEGAFPITSVATDTFTIDISSLGTTPTSSGSGGGSSIAYTCNSLNTGIPTWFGIWNERLCFDVAFSQASIGKMQYYRSLPLLSASNTTNFLTTRYPQLMRTACVTQAADFMKDDGEYQKGMTRLTALVQRVNIENDGSMRGMDLSPIY